MKIPNLKICTLHVVRKGKRFGWYKINKEGTCLSFLGKLSEDHMSLVVRKPVFRVSDLVRHKPSCAVTEDG